MQGVTQAKQVLGALRDLGKSVHRGLAVDPPVCPAPLQGAHGNEGMGAGIGSSGALPGTPP